MPSKKLKKMGVSKEKFDSCVSQVKRKGGGNPHAVCESSLQKSRRRKKLRERMT